MEDEIFDMEQVLEMDDSFCVNDSDVLKILKTWRLTTGNEGAEEQHTAVQQQLMSSSKFIDSRTFTRPKKKLMQYPDYNFPSTNLQHQQDPSPNRAGFNLQIGGAFTNPLSNSIMQRSLITDVSPPNSLASSMSYNECGNSLITSGDFSNIGCLLNNQDDDNFFRVNGMQPLTRQSLVSVSERNSKFSNNLFDDSKDNNILKTDMHGIEEQVSSGNSTLQNSMELISNGSDIKAKNDTFKVANNATFDASGGPVLNQTFDQVGVSPKNNNTFVKNGTHCLEPSPDKLPTSSTVVLNDPDLNSPVTDRVITQIPDQSTPAIHQSRLQKFGHTIVVEDLSPITSQPTTLRRKARLTVEQDDDNKRISLQNFEDVEKSISLLENTHDEEGFDVILEDITDLKRSLDANEKFKQSLQNIKNRHSQANLERQQEEMFRKKFDATMTLDNKLMDSMNKSMSSSGGSERLLNRRSRLDDGIVLPIQTDTITNGEPPETSKTTLVVEGNGSGGGNPDRKANRDRFKTMRITKKHIEGMIVIDGEEKEQDDYDEAEEMSKDPNVEVINGAFVHLATKAEQGEIDDEDEPLFKKPIIPQKPLNPLNGAPFRARSLSKPKYYSGFYSDRKGSLQLQLVGKASSIDHLDSNRMNSQENINTTITIQTGSSQMGTMKPGSNLKSPMGAKSKSYHNLVYSSGSNNTGIKPLTSAPKYVSRYGQTAMRAPPPTKSSGIEPLKKSAFANTQLPGKQFMKQPITTNTRKLKPSDFRIPASVSSNNNLTKEASSTYGSSQGLAKPLSINKPGNVRPSSGYQSYNNTNVSNNNFRNKGNDSDPESERCSPNSLCSSSASSRGSLHRSENTQQASTHKMLNSVEDISIGSDTAVIKQPPPSRLARPSGLKQPTAVRSALPRPTNFTKR